MPPPPSKGLPGPGCAWKLQNSALELRALVHIGLALPLQSEASCISSWGFDFPVCKVGITIPPISLGYLKDKTE